MCRELAFWSDFISVLKRISARNLKNTVFSSKNAVWRSRTTIFEKHALLKQKYFNRIHETISEIDFTSSRCQVRIQNAHKSPDTMPHAFPNKTMSPSPPAHVERYGAWLHLDLHRFCLRTGKISITRKKATRNYSKRIHSERLTSSPGRLYQMLKENRRQQTIGQQTARIHKPEYRQHLHQKEKQRTTANIHQTVA